MYVNGILSYSLSPIPIIHAEPGNAAVRHEFEPIAKPRSELFRQSGPSLKSPISPAQNGEIKTRPLEPTAITIDSQDRKNNNSSTSIAGQETTTFYMAASIYIKDILIMTKQN